MGQKFVAGAMFLICSLTMIDCGGSASWNAFWRLATRGSLGPIVQKARTHAILVVLPLQRSKDIQSPEIMPFWNYLSRRFEVENGNALSTLKLRFDGESLRRVRFAPWTLFRDSPESEGSTVGNSIVAQFRLTIPLNLTPNIQPLVTFDRDLADGSLPPLSVVIAPRSKGQSCGDETVSCSDAKAATDADTFLNREVRKFLNDGFLRNNFLLVTCGDATILVSDITEKESQAVSNQDAGNSSTYSAFPGAQSTEMAAISANENAYTSVYRSGSSGVQAPSGLGTPEQLNRVGTDLPAQSDLSLVRGVNWGTPGAIGSSTPNTARFTKTAVRSLNAIRFADQFPNIEAAGADCGMEKCVIVVPPSYSGTDCATNYRPNVTYIDYRGNTLCLLNSTTYNYVTPGQTWSMIRDQMRVTGALTSGGGTVALYPITEANNVTGNGTQVIDGFAADAQLTGSLTGSLGYLTGGEFAAVGLSAGGYARIADGVQGYFTNSVGSTTEVNEVRGVDGIGCGQIFGARPHNCYGLFGRYQSGASSRNYSIGLDGLGLLLYNSSFQAAGLDAEDASHTPHRFLYIANDDSTNIQAVNLYGTNLEDSTGTTRLHLDSKGIEVSGDAQVRGVSTLAGGFKAGANGSRISDSRFLAQFAGALTTSAETTDTVSIPGVTSSSRCSLTPTNASAAKGAESTYISAKDSNAITVSHSPEPGMTYDIICTAD